jgi:hypothetical protein
MNEDKDSDVEIGRRHGCRRGKGADSNADDG